MKSQRYSAANQGQYYYGDDCPAWAFSFDNQKAIEKPFNYHWHAELEVYYVEEGVYEIYSDQKTYTLNKGDIFIMRPGVDHSIRSTSHKAKYFSVGISTRLLSLDEGHFFQTEFLEPLGRGMLDFDPVVQPGDSNYHAFLAPIEQIISSMPQKDKVSMFCSAINICCALIRRSVRNEKKSTGFSKEHEAVQQCIMYMQKNYMDKITLQQLAELSSLHPNYLCALFNKYTGSTPMAYLSKIRMRRARILLRETELNVRQVAERTGFNSASFFSKRFKAVMGVSPTEYGNAYRKKGDVK